VGKGIAALALLLLAGETRADDKLVRPLGDSEIDWGAGTISAHGGAAADLRMPSAEIARPGPSAGPGPRPWPSCAPPCRPCRFAPAASCRRADLEAALGRAHPAGVDYQSNGGVLLTMSLAFGDIVPPKEKDRKPPDAGVETTRKAPEQALAVASMPFELAPRVVAGEREAALSWRSTARARRRRGWTPSPSSATAAAGWCCPRARPRLCRNSPARRW
jgi:hypothetical protein